MYPIRSFVVRIYRQDRRSIAGSVEDVRSGKSTFFQSFSDLWNVLTARSRAAAAASRPSVETGPAEAGMAAPRPAESGPIDPATAAASGDRENR
jgi:hypothetical protein